MATTLQHSSTNEKSILDKINQLAHQVDPLSTKIQQFDTTNLYDELLRWKTETYHIIDKVYEQKRIQLQTIIEQHKSKQEKIISDTKDALLQLQVKGDATREELEQLEQTLHNVQKAIDKFIMIKTRPLDTNNSIIIELNDDCKSPNLTQSRPTQEFTFSHLNEEDFKSDGLRTYAKYRNLGIAKATNGMAMAHVLRFIPPFRPESTSEMALQIMGRYSNPPPSEIPTTADFRNTIMAIVGNCGFSLQSDVVS
ncbi:unnamed protein product [Rotaria sordida]|uniref:Uncharacterized protein n=2 Tax=Rotaria sordida TaxID=392033 RepID=A0A819C525_9BILA|nr:unnamed protein product [Rotaria sordida]